MRILSTLLIFGGYVLVYASVANHGRWYAQPWQGVWMDAYTPKHDSATESATQHHHHSTAQPSSVPGAITGRLFPPGRSPGVTGIGGGH